MSVDLDVISTMRDEPYLDDYVPYRALSRAAVTGCVLGALGLLTFLNPLFGAIGVLGAIVSLMAYRSIRANRDSLTGERVALTGLAMSLGFCTAAWGFHTIVYFTEVPDGFERVSYQLLQPDGSQPNQIVPTSALELDGKQVFIKGYMFPPSQLSGISEFVLVRDNGDCCFGGSTPKLTDMILVQLAEPLKAQYSTRLLSLAGTFHVRQGDGGRVGVVLYHLDATYLK